MISLAFLALKNSIHNYFNSPLKLTHNLPPSMNFFIVIVKKNQPPQNQNMTMDISIKVVVNRVFYD